MIARPPPAPARARTAEMIGQRPRRHEDRAFLPQDRRELLLQSLNRAAIGIGIAMDPAFVRHPRQEASLFGRESKPSPSPGHAHPPRVGSEERQRGGATRRRRGPEEARAESDGSGLQEASSGKVVHGVLTLRAPGCRWLAAAPGFASGAGSRSVSMGAGVAEPAYPARSNPATSVRTCRLCGGGAKAIQVRDAAALRLARPDVIGAGFALPRDAGRRPALHVPAPSRVVAYCRAR